MNNIQGIQMIGTQRSGSNLLRVIMNGLDNIFAPHPPHILQRFIPLLPKYGNLSNKDNFKKLCSDVKQLITLNPVPWKNIEKIELPEIIEYCNNNTLFDIYKTIYDLAAYKNNKDTWINKSMNNVYYAHEIENIPYNPYYLYLFRDGRDVALSFQKAIVGEKHIYAIAEKWKNDQEAALKIFNNIDKKRIHLISYENLINNTEKSIKKLCNALNLPYSDNLLNYYNSTESKNTAKAGKMWNNVEKPILKNNSKKYLKDMKEEDILIFESVAGDTLEKLGYELVFEKTKRLSFSENKINSFLLENKKLKEKFILKTSKEDIEKRKPQKMLLDKIKQYKI